MTNHHGTETEEQTSLLLQNNLKIFLRRALYLVSAFFLISCSLLTTRPRLEMTLATSALKAAKSQGAPTKATQDYRKAEYYYEKAKNFYRLKLFNEAKYLSILSLRFSERAEEKARMSDIEDESNDNSVESPDSGQ